VGDNRIGKNNSSEPNFLLDTVSVTTIGGGQWANGAMTTGAGGSRVSNSVISLGSSGKIAGICLSVISASPFTVLFQVLNTHFYWCAQAEQVTSLVASQGVEGVFNTNVNADQVINFFNYSTSASSYSPPEMVFEATEVSFYNSLFSVSYASGTYVADWIIRDGWYIQVGGTGPRRLTNVELGEGPSGHCGEGPSPAFGGRGAPSSLISM
jgi:hypothetical protein